MTTQPKNDLPYKFVNEILSYDSKRGEIRWKVDRPPRGKAEELAGCKRADGYLVIGICGRMYLGHRIAHLLMTKRWPKNQIDHINGKPEDISWKNLREATHSENKCNRRAQSNNTSGYKGVTKRADCDRWQAVIQIAGRHFYLGVFKTAKAAATAYKKAAKQKHKTFYRD